MTRSHSLVVCSEYFCTLHLEIEITTDTPPPPMCPDLTDPANGFVSVTGNSPGDTATYTCEADYDLVGMSERECGADGMWTGEAPMCIRK